jgi:nucleoside-diphosphate-sugar epimerase
MRIILTGATGFIGRHIARALLADGHHVTGCARDREDAFRRYPELGWIRADFSRERTMDAWERRLTGHEDVVINAVGILRERGRQTYEALHFEAPRALFNACAAKGVKRVIHISALGFDPASHRPYEETKLRLERHLATLDLDWVIVRPALVYGDDSPSSALLRSLANLPLVPLVGDGGQLLQPIHVDDLSLAVARLVASGQPKRAVVELGGPRPVTYKELLGGLRTSPGASRYLRIPPTVARAGAYLADFADVSEFSVDNLNLLLRGNTTCANAASGLLGHEPRDVAKSLP